MNSSSESSNIKTITAKLISRDEMNLAEFPLTVLSTRADPSIKTLEFKDSVRMKNGDLVERSWIITGADKFGLPTSSDDEVLLGLLKLTVDSGMENRKVHFTRYELMKILRWSTEGRNYSRLQKALDRLSGVRIKAKNGFYDNDLKSHSTKNFGIIDEYEINDGKEQRPSFFSWSEVLFKSFQVGFIKKLDLDFYLDLQSAVSKRLYRYLDKHFWYKSKIQVDLFTLAHEKIGVSRTYKYVSSLRQQLDPAVKELIEKGFLGKCEYIQKLKGADVVFYAPGVSKISGNNKEAFSSNTQNIFRESDEKNGLQGDPKSIDLLEKLQAHGINEKSARKILENKSPDVLQRILLIVNYFEKLRSQNSRLISKNPAGFLYKACIDPFAFSLPDDGKNFTLTAQKRKNQEEVAKKSMHSSLEGDYLTARKRELQRLMQSSEKSILDKVKAEVELGLSKLKSSISEENFKRALQHGVEEKLAKLFALPTFSEWILNKGKVDEEAQDQH